MSTTASIMHDEEATIPALLKHWASIDPDTPAYIFVGKQTRTVLSRREVFTLSGRMSAKLRRLGVCKGDVVANTLSCSPEGLICNFAIMMAGGVTQSAIGYLSNADDTVGALRVAQTSVIIADPETKSTFDILMKMVSSYKETEYGLELLCPKLPFLTKLIYVRSKNVKQLCDEPDVFMEKLCPSDYAVIVETSGTSGICKQVPRTHSSVVNFGEQMRFLVGENASPFFNNRFFGWFPGHPSLSLCCGITRVLLDASEVSLPDIFDVIRSEGCRSALLMPSEIEDVISSMGEVSEKCQPLEVIVTGGQPISRRTMRIIGKFTKQVVVRYGMSETLCINRMVVDSELKYSDHCVGTPMPSYQARVVDDDAKDAKHGELGNIIVKGSGVFNGYLGHYNTSQQHNPCSTRFEAKANVFEYCNLNKEAFTDDGWFRTGDVGFFDQKGNLYVNGRGSDAIMHGDEILYPAWLERLALGCPAVDHLVLVPVRDPVMCHEICACIKPMADWPGDPIEEVQNFLHQQLTIIEASECSIMPKFYLKFAHFPLNKNSKVNRKELSRIAGSILKL